MDVKKQVISTALILGAFGLAGAGLVTTVEKLTRSQREASIVAARLKSLHAVIPPEIHDNDLLDSTVRIEDPAFSPKYPTIAYLARSGDKPVAVAFETTAPEGYAGPIRIMIGIDISGEILGVRVLDHRETPGLGDAIEVERSDWILRFAGKSIGNPPVSRWAVKKDGGVFDQFTGATITPRLVVNTVKKTLLYFQQHKDTLFSAGETP
jgi:electron transport complex protein RnfG